MTHDFYPAGSVFHADVLALPSVSTGGGIGEAVFAVQTGSTKVTSDVNFVAVNTYTERGSLKWQVGYSAAKYQDARRSTLAQIDDVPASLAPDHPVGVTLRTDGYHTLDVYLDDTKILEARNLAMQHGPAAPALPRSAGEGHSVHVAVHQLLGHGLGHFPRRRAARGRPRAPRVIRRADRERHRRCPRHGAPQTPVAEGARHGSSGRAVPGRDARRRRVSTAFTYSGGDRYNATVTEAQ